MILFLPVIYPIITEFQEKNPSNPPARSCIIKYGFKSKNRGIFMAQRLATVFVKTSLQLSEGQMLQFIRLFAEHDVQLLVKVTENGTQEMVFHDDSGKEVVLAFERKAGKFVCTGNCCLASTRLANVMRKAVSLFRGDAIVRRIYIGFTMEYHYVKGTVVKIAELRDEQIKVIYEYKDTLGQLEALYLSMQVEEEIRSLRRQIDSLLDRRNSAASTSEIDSELNELSRRLFVLEA